MSIFEDSNTLLYVCNVTNGNAAAFASLPNGSGAFYHYPNGALNEDAIAAGETVYFVHRNSRGVLHFSPPIDLNRLRNASSMDNEARIEQVTYLGYNGTSGSMDVANSTYFGLQIVLDHTFGMLNNSPLILTVPYKTGAAATQYELANGIATEARKVLLRHNACISVTVINSGAQLDAVAAGGAATAAVVNGSKVITLSSDQSTVVFAGSLLRLGTSGAGTAAVYKVVSIAAGGQIVTLDRPYEGATNATYGAALIETVTEGNYGLCFTGVSITDANFNPITDEPFVVSFTLGTGDFTTATVTKTTNPVIGSGTYQQVAALEAYTQFQQKTKENSAYPPTTRLIEATAGAAYELHMFEIWDQNFVDATTGIRPISKTRIIIAEVSTIDDDFDDNIIATTVTAVI